MYESLPLVARIAPVIVVAATNTTIVAAPGVGFRHRLVGVQLMVNRAATGVADFAVTDGAGGTVLLQAGGLSVAGLPDFAPPIPEPGIPFSLNTAMVVNEAATIAAGNYVAVVYYYTDAVN